MDIQEIIDLLEKASGDICEAQMSREKFDSLSLARQKIAHALTLFKQQPTAGEFTKKLRNDIGKYKYGYQDKLKVSAIVEQSEELCDRLDRAEAINKELLEACRVTLGWYSKMAACEQPDCRVCREQKKQKDQVEAAIAKAKKEG